MLFILLIYSECSKQLNQIANALSLAIITTPHLRERHVGVMQGLTKQHIREQHGEHFDFDWEIIPGGETKTEFLKRIRDEITLIANNHVNASVIIVTHGLAIRNFLTSAGYDLDELPSITNASIITIKYYEDAPQFELISIECVR